MLSKFIKSKHLTPQEKIFEENYGSAGMPWRQSILEWGVFILLVAGFFILVL